MLAIVKDPRFWLLVLFAGWTAGVWHFGSASGAAGVREAWAAETQRQLEEANDAHTLELARLSVQYRADLSRAREAAEAERRRRTKLEGYVNEILSTPAPDCTELPDVWVSRAVEALTGTPADAMPSADATAGEAPTVHAPP